jgi:predicted transcriptional regulator
MSAPAGNKNGQRGNEPRNQTLRIRITSSLMGAIDALAKKEGKTRTAVVEERLVDLYSVSDTDKT